MKKFFKVILITLLVVVIAVCTFLATLFLGGFGKIPSEDDLIDLRNENASIVISKEGNVIGKFFSENRTDVPYDSLPTHLVNALIATEDARFYEHKGVDSRALVRVLLKTIMLGDRSAGGGSTLSQQLAKNLYGRKDYGKITILVNKLKEIILANKLENIYSKEDIVELYLNTVPFGENVFGIEVAAQRFFSVSVTELKIEQAAVLVGILKANTTYNPRLYPENAIKRRTVVLQQMQKANHLTLVELDSLKKLDLGLNYSNLSKSNEASYYLQQVKEELKASLAKVEKETGIKYDLKRDGLTIETTLNANLQKAANVATTKHLANMQIYLDKLYAKGSSKKELEELALKIAKQKKIDLSDTEKKKRVVFNWDDELDEKLSLKDSLIHTLKQLHAGILGLNPNSGAIECWMGGINFNLYPYDQILAKRQLASTFKPFLYANALRSGRSACDYIKNDEIVLNDYENWTPQNYDGKSGGSYSLAAALALSKNLPTVHLYFETELTELESLWTKLGFLEPLNEGPSVILGTNSVSMLELATAYSVFANGGNLISPYTLEKIRDANGKIIFQKDPQTAQKVMDKEVTSQLNEILEKAVNEGTGSSIRSRFNIKIPLAGKTGTSQNFADAWFVAYNSKLVLVSRVGASFPSVHFKSGTYGSGGKLALPLTAFTLQEALKNKKFKQNQNSAQLNSTQFIDCEDFKEDNLIQGLFKSFRKKETNVKKERKKAEKKKKIKGFFKSVFGEKKEE